MTYESLFALIAGLLSTVGAIIAMVNWMNSRFERLSHRIESVQHSQSVKDTELRSQIEILEYRANENTNLISHRTERFQSADKDIHARITEEVRRLSSQIEQLQGYMTKQGFIPRDRE